MKRARATTLLQEMLRRLDEGGWPLDLVDEVHVFGSYARGALEPADVDVVVEHRRDDRLIQEIVSALSYGRDPQASLKRALKGRSRGLQIQFEQYKSLSNEGIPMHLLWQRGDSIETAEARLSQLLPDVSAGRAPRDDMVEQFDGLDRWIPRPVRGELVRLLRAGAIDLHRLELPDAHPQDPEALRALERWSDTSPLRRSAAAVLSHLESCGRDVTAVNLHGAPVGPRHDEAPSSTRVSFGWRYFDQLTWHLKQERDWIEVIRPTRTQPLHALHIVLRDRALVDTA